MRIETFDFSIDMLSSLLWQYNKATHLQGLLQKKQEWYDENHKEFWENWYNDVFNLETANDFGLAVWSIILNVPLFINESNIDPPGKPIYGFDVLPTTNDNENFERGNFSNRGDAIVLTTEEQRLLLRLRYYQLVSRGNVVEINNFLHVLFNSNTVPYQGNVWVLDGLDMTMTYVFDFAIPKKMRFILRQFDILPRPAGVGLKYVILTDTIFGFGPSDFPYQNFENGDFIPENF